MLRYQSAMSPSASIIVSTGYLLLLLGDTTIVSSKLIILVSSILIYGLFFFPPGDSRAKDTRERTMQPVIDVTEAPFIIWIIMIACLWVIFCVHDTSIVLVQGDRGYPSLRNAVLSTVLCGLSARLAWTVCRNRWRGGSQISEYGLVAAQ